MSKYIERFSVEGKKVVVTGGSKGIGFEVAAVLADAGADIAIVGRDKAGLATTEAAVKKAGRDCLVLEADFRTVEGPLRDVEAGATYYYRLWSVTYDGEREVLGIKQHRVKTEEETE